jgi:hypothetical protein
LIEIEKFFKKEKMEDILTCSVPDFHKPLTLYMESKVLNFFESFLIAGNFQKIFAIPMFFFFLDKKIWNLFCFPLFLFFSLIFFFIFLKKKILWFSFSKSIITYEESSWFDSHYWEKPIFLIKTDRLLLFQKIFPLIKTLAHQIQQFFVFFFFYIVISY